MSAPNPDPDGYLPVDRHRLRAITPDEFRRVLDYISTTAGLTPAQIHVKTKIPRSSAYAMSAANSRSPLPRKEEHVRKYLRACNLAPVYEELVMSTWRRLNDEFQVKRVLHSVPPTPDPSKDTDGGEGYPSALLPLEDQGAVWFGSRRRRSTRTVIDLLFLILESDRRTRRALRLLIPVVAGWVMVVIAFVVWAILSHVRFETGVTWFGVLLMLISAGLGVRLPLRSLRRTRSSSKTHIF